MAAQTLSDSTNARQDPQGSQTPHSARIFQDALSDDETSEAGRPHKRQRVDNVLDPELDDAAPISDRAEKTSVKQETSEKHLLPSHTPCLASPQSSHTSSSHIKTAPTESESLAPPPPRKYRAIVAAPLPPKELKPIEKPRRTKTGCLVCRKRRIKCDERYPTCVNCGKGNRRCIYDSPRVSDGAKLEPVAQDLAHTDSARERWLPVPSETKDYDIEAAPDMGDSGTALRGPNTSLEIHNKPDDATIDPALAGSFIANQSSAPERPTTAQPSTNDDSRPPKTPIDQTSTGRAPLTMAELSMIGGADPPTPKISTPLTAATRSEIQYLYEHEYARGIDSFLETTWYTKHGMAVLLSNQPLMETFAGVLELFANTPGGNFERMRYLPSAESQLVWGLMALPRDVKAYESPEDVARGPKIEGDSASLTTVLRRLQIVECLITGTTLRANPLALSLSPTPNRVREISFWKHLGGFVMLHGELLAQKADDKGAAASASRPLTEATANLQAMRQLLDEVESRDVLYSMAIAQHLGARHLDVMGGQGQGSVAGADVAVSQQVQQDRQKLSVAKLFLENEAHGEGTTQVVQRLCGMAVRSWARLLER